MKPLQNYLLKVILWVFHVSLFFGQLLHQILNKIIYILSILIDTIVRTNVRNVSTAWDWLFTMNKCQTRQNLKQKWLLLFLNFCSLNFKRWISTKIIIENGFGLSIKFRIKWFWTKHSPSIYGLQMKTKHAWKK